jgi:hypothetical protein
VSFKHCKLSEGARSSLEEARSDPRRYKIPTPESSCHIGVAVLVPDSKGTNPQPENTTFSTIGSNFRLQKAPILVSWGCPFKCQGCSFRCQRCPGVKGAHSGTKGAYSGPSGFQFYLMKPLSHRSWEHTIPRSRLLLRGYSQEHTVPGRLFPGAHHS